MHQPLAPIQIETVASFPLTGNELGRGSQYVVFEARSDSAQVLKVPRSRVDPCEPTLPEAVSLYGLRAAQRSGWSFILNTTILVCGEPGSQDERHVLRQPRTARFLAQELLTAATSGAWEDLLRQIHEVLACEEAAWRTGLFFQDTGGFFANFTIPVAGTILATDLSSCTDEWPLALLWLRSRWCVDRQAWLIDLARRHGAPSVVLDSIFCLLRQHYCPFRVRTVYRSRGGITHA